MRVGRQVPSAWSRCGRAMLLTGALVSTQIGFAHADAGLPAGSGGPGAGSASVPPGGTLDFWSMLFVFVLASLIGLGVIRRVSRLLHTPLMSLTNAISAIAVVGSIIVAGSDYPKEIRFLGFVALAASMTNIVSGFLITDRMLKMFRVDRAPKPSERPASGNGSRP